MRKKRDFLKLTAKPRTSVERKTIREDCEDINMSILEASRLSWDRTKWRNTVHSSGCRSARQRHRRRGHNSS